MNERIKELAIEAKLISAIPNGFNETELSAEQVKFAFFLVQECFMVMRPMIRYEVRRNLALDAIREHFGHDIWNPARLKEYNDRQDH